MPASPHRRQIGSPLLCRSCDHERIVDRITGEHRDSQTERIVQFGQHRVDRIAFQPPVDDTYIIPLRVEIRSDGNKRKGQGEENGAGIIEYDLLSLHEPLIRENLLTVTRKTLLMFQHTSGRDKKYQPVPKVILYGHE